MKALTLVLAAAGVLFLAGGAQAAPGDLDGSFGTGGIVRTDFGAVNPFEDAAAVLVQPDQKIVAVGTSSGCCGDGNIALARYSAAGTLDPTFGSGGKVLTDLQSASIDVGVGAALQPDGKIVVVGQTYAGLATGFDFFVARYLPGGALDPTFGNGGFVIQDLLGAGGYDTAYAVAVQKNRRIVVAGTSTAADGIHYDVAMVRYRPDGRVDKGFGKKGLVLAGPAPASDDWAYGLAIDKKGRIVVAGQTYDAGETDFLAARFHPNGKPDTSFGSHGYAKLDLGGDDVAWGLALQPDGRIVLAGSSDGDFALARLDARGRLDGSFGDGGVTVTDLGGEDGANGLVLQPDGSIVVAGASDAGGDPDLAIARYGANGVLDPGFGAGGTALADVGGDDYAYSIARQADGKIVAGGTTNAGANQDFVLARFLP